MDIKSTMAKFGFGHRIANHIIIDSKGELWLTMTPMAVGGLLPLGMTALPGTLRLEPLENGEAVPFTYTATEAELILKTEKGAKIRLVIDTDAHALRIAGNSAFRLNGVEAAGRAVSINAAEGAYMSVGAYRYFMTPKKGTITFDDTYLVAKFCSDTPVLEIEPDNGEFELYVYDLPEDTEPIPVTKTIDEAAAQNTADFETFKNGLVDIPAEWGDVKEKIAYTLWLCQRTVAGKGEVTIENKYNSGRTGATQMAIASMAFKDARRVVDMLLAYPAELPLITGVAIARLLDEELLNDSRGEIFRAYAALEPLARYCMQERTTDGDGLSYYAYRYESGHSPSPAFFKAGEPVLAPDLNAYLIVAGDTLGKLAKLEYDDGMAMKWDAQARGLTAKLIAELWNGEDFIGKNAYTGKLSGPDAVLSLVPIILGCKLPLDIIKKLAAKIDDNAVGTAKGLLLVGGLFDAGEKETAKGLVTKALTDARASAIECPFYGAALLAMAHKVL